MPLTPCTASENVAVTVVVAATAVAPAAGVRAVTVGAVEPAQVAVGVPTLLPLGSLTEPVKVSPQKGPEPVCRLMIP